MDALIYMDMPIDRDRDVRSDHPINSLYVGKIGLSISYLPGICLEDCIKVQIIESKMVLAQTKSGISGIIK